MTAPLNLGILGAGRIGRVHARTIATRLPQARLRAVADPDAEAAGRLAAECGVPRVADDPAEVLADGDVQAVLICSATDTHAGLVERAAAAGKHIFCEKPLDLDLARIDRLLAAVAAAGVTLMVGFNRRFDPDFARMRGLIASGSIGIPHLLRLTSRDPSPPPPGYLAASGGLFLDMTIHDFDLARFLLGDEVVEVHAAGGVLVDPAIGEAGDVDTAVVLLRFAGGALGAIDNSRRAVYGYDQRAEVLGSAGMLANRNQAADTVERSDAGGLHAPPPFDFFMQRYAASYAAEMAAFLDCVQRGRPAPVGGADGRAAVLLGHAARRSLAENRPVRVAELGG